LKIDNKYCLNEIGDTNQKYVLFIRPRSDDDIFLNNFLFLQTGQRVLAS
jgi:hypothetical protein